MALLEEFRSAEIFVFPTRKEHMGQALAEAAAAGLPIIVTDVGGTSQVVRHAAACFQAACAFSRPARNASGGPPPKIQPSP